MRKEQRPGNIGAVRLSAAKLTLLKEAILAAYKFAAKHKYSNLDSLLSKAIPSHIPGTIHCMEYQTPHPWAYLRADDSCVKEMRLILTMNCQHEHGAGTVNVELPTTEPSARLRPLKGATIVAAAIVVSRCFIGF